MRQKFRGVARMQEIRLRNKREVWDSSIGKWVKIDEVLIESLNHLEKAVALQEEIKNWTPEQLAELDRKLAEDFVGAGEIERNIL